MQKDLTGAVNETFSNLLGERGFKGIYAFSSEDGSAAHINYPIRSDFFTIIVVERGTFRVRVNLKEYSLTKDTFAVAAPAALKEVITISGGCKYVGLIFTAEYLAKIGMHKHRIDTLHFFTTDQMPLLSLTPEDQKRLTHLILELRHTGQYPVGYPYAEEITRFGFLMLMYEMASVVRRLGLDRRAAAKLDRKEELTMRFASLVSQHFREKRKVFEYADMLHVTPKYLSQAVKDYTGKSAGTFIDETIIREAKFLLINPSLSIQEITEYFNFPNQSQFGKFFKHYTGYSPLTYRKIPNK